MWKDALSSLKRAMDGISWFRKRGMPWFHPSRKRRRQPVLYRTLYIHTQRPIASIFANELHDGDILEICPYQEEPSADERTYGMLTVKDMYQGLNNWPKLMQYHRPNGFTYWVIPRLNLTAFLAKHPESLQGTIEDCLAAYQQALPYFTEIVDVTSGEVISKRSHWEPPAESCIGGHITTQPVETDIFWALRIPLGHIGLGCCRIAEDARAVWLDRASLFWWSRSWVLADGPAEQPVYPSLTSVSQYSLSLFYLSVCLERAERILSQKDDLDTPYWFHNSIRTGCRVGQYL